MRNLLLLICLFFGLSGMAQTPTGFTPVNAKYRWLSGKFDSTFIIPRGSTPSLRGTTDQNTGSLFYNTTDSTLKIYTGTQWINAVNGITSLDGAAGIDSASTHKIGIGITSSFIGKLHIRTNNLLSTPNDSSGLYLQNSTAATTTNKIQMSPSVVWEGYAWKNTGSLSQKHLWRADVLPVNSTVQTSTSKWRLATSVAGGAYSNVLELTTSVGGGGFLSILQSGGSYGSINGVPMGTSALSTSNIYYGQMIPVASTGTNNTSVGVSALQVVTSGSNNTAVGSGALLADTSGQYNTAVGYRSLAANTNGEQNTAIGMNALLNNTTAQKNTAVGTGSMENNRTGGFNTGIGHDALLHVTTGNQNVGLGWLAGSLDSTSSDNTSIGTSSARSMIGGSGNTMIGSQAGYNGSQLITAKYSIGLGYGAYTRADYQLALSDSITRIKADGMKRNIAGYVLTDSTGSGDLVLKSVSTESTYTPVDDGTLTNVDAETFYSTNYIRVGNWVQVWGVFEVNATSSGVTTELLLRLPVASDLSAQYTLSGTGACEDNTVVAITGDASTDKAKVRFKPQSSTNQTYSFTFSYKVQ